VDEVEGAGAAEEKKTRRQGGEASRLIRNHWWQTSHPVSTVQGSRANAEHGDKTREDHNNLLKIIRREAEIITISERPK